MSNNIKFPCVEVTRQYMETVDWTWKLSEFDLIAEMDDCEVGDEIVLRYVELTQEEFDALLESYV